MSVVAAEKPCFKNTFLAACNTTSAFSGNSPSEDVNLATVRALPFSLSWLDDFSIIFSYF
jgi:hypothetical protein